jgi:hypothetical protein
MGRGRRKTSREEKRVGPLHKNAARRLLLTDYIKMISLINFNQKIQSNLSKLTSQNQLSDGCFSKKANILKVIR